MKAFEKTIRKQINKKLPFIRKEVSIEDARKQFANNPYKLAIIDDIEKSGETVSLYSTGDFVDLCEKSRVEIKDKKVAVQRKVNGLRHSYCTYHFAAHGNEGLTAQAAGNTPQQIHAHYKGLATKAEGEAWFAVAPAQAANVITLANAAKG